MSEASNENSKTPFEPGWQEAIGAELRQEYMEDLKRFLKAEHHNGAKIYPKNADIFNAFNYTPFGDVKVVIIGQDPYHGENQAHGLAFSVQKGIVIPPSLKNIYKELETDVEGFMIPNHGNLKQWAERGVFLLNATLTVRAHEPGSHQDKGWEIFTDKVIATLSEKKHGLVFLLWGKFAQQKSALIDKKKHTILKAAHPSPFSVHRGFFGCRHFSEANAALLADGQEPIDWQIT